MRKNIIVLLLFVVLWPVRATEVDFVELDCSHEAYACKGRYCEIKTSFNAVSSAGQKLWTFQDSLMDDCNAFQDPLEDYEYNALKIHTCSVTSEGGYFSNMLIGKLELNPANKHPRRAFQTFLSQSISLGGTKIYAWVDQGSGLLELLKSDYCFKESNETLFIPLTSRKVFCPHLNTIQLKATKQDIRDAFY